MTNGSFGVFSRHNQKSNNALSKEGDISQLVPRLSFMFFTLLIIKKNHLINISNIILTNVLSLALVSATEVDKKRKAGATVHNTERNDHDSGVTS
jgi:hypothetical protein